MIPLYKVHMPADLKEEIDRILHSGQLAYGKNSRLFEEKLRDYLGNPYVVTTSTHNHALQISFDLLGIGPGDEVIASPMSCLATNQPVITNRGTVVWADIDPRTGTLDPDDVKKRITARTKAILHYHWCGYPGDIDGINQVAREHGIMVVEDATEAFGAEYKNRKIGSTGSDVVCFSFQTVRLPNTIDGGAIAFSSKDLFEKASLMRDYGIERKRFRDGMGEISLNCDIPIRGYGAMMNEVSAFIGCRQMDFFDGLLHRQRENAETFLAALVGCRHCEPLVPLANAKPSFWVFSLVSGESERILAASREQGIWTSRVHSRNDFYSCFGGGPHTELKRVRTDLRGVSTFAATELCIPSGWWVGERERQIITSVVRQS
jgi:perosamine synthetase